MRVFKKQFLICFFCFISLPIYAEEIKLANGEWAPYLSKELPHYGYASHLVTEAFREVKVEVKYEFYPWARAENYVKTGRIDGSVVWSKQTEREKFAYFSDPVIEHNVVLWHLKKRPIVWNTNEDLYGLRIGIPLGSKLGITKELNETGKIKLYRTPNIKSGFLMILAERIDVQPVIDLVGYHLLGTQFTSEEQAKIIHTKPTRNVKYHLMLSKAIPGNKLLSEKFNQGLRRLKETGEYSKMEKDFYAGLYD